ncbi:MAG TPA: hypothetical protein VGO62_15240 [Myxococcota bacterium]|jgi:hypothetical protein
MPTASSQSGRRTREHRTWAHRYGPVCAISPDEQAALGIRYDEDNPAIAETFLLRLSPGRTEAIDQHQGVARAVAASTSGALFVLDDSGTVHVGGRRHKLAVPRTMVDAGALGMALAADDQIWLFAPDGSAVSPGPKLRARQLASSRAGLVAATDDDGVYLVGESGVAVAVPVDLPGHVNAVALADGGRIAVAAGHDIYEGDASGLKLVASAPFEIHCLAIHLDRVLLSSRAHGLFCIEDGRVMPLKPSLRAHTLAVKDNILVAASDLFVATADGPGPGDFLTRDLAPFVRVAEQRLPRLLQSEDPVSV